VVGFQVLKNKRRHSRGVASASAVDGKGGACLWVEEDQTPKNGWEKRQPAAAVASATLGWVVHPARVNQVVEAEDHGKVAVLRRHWLQD
jgi:hypothetical protein